MAGRNEIGTVMSTSKAYQVCREQEAGDGISRGRVSLPDGSPALLVGTDDTILVMALSAEQGVPSTPDPGQRLQIAQDGSWSVRDAHRVRGR